MTDRAEVPVTLENLQAAAARTKWENYLLRDIRALRLPEPTREYEFARPDRRWRFDFAWVAQRVGAEVDGGIHRLGGGRHQRGVGFERDIEKFNDAVLRGWRVLRFTPDHVRSGYAVGKLEEILHD